MKESLQDMLDDCDRELEDIGKRIEKTDAYDKIRNYLTNYALIKASGTLEFIYRSIVADYFLKLSDARIENYLDATIRQGSLSVIYDNMCRLLRRFDDKWEKTFKTNVNLEEDGKSLIDSSNSLVKNRHNFAHGKNPTATYLDIMEYYKNVKKLVGIFDDVVVD